ncbi:MAG TPA: 4Fe-4S ferredoxin [Candidatus Korarchaeota archaeon]|nr:4Fe-4S ferredoxin [Candidatus Korarchaeota archaeon]
MLDLLSTNAGSRLIRREGKLRVLGACIPVEWPEVAEEFCQEGLCLSACPEHDHINVISLKLASILARVEVGEIDLLTVDGSPHCLQLHHAIEEAIKVAGRDVEVKHMVLYKGKLYEVSRKAVKLARYLHRVDELMKMSGGEGPEISNS